MDPNSSLGKIYLGENVVEISSDKVRGSRDWNSLEFQDTTNSGQKKETKAIFFHQMDTEEVSDRFMAPCFVNGLEAYDGEINLEKELIVALRGEIYFVRFIINPEEDDVEHGVIPRRSFLHTEKEEKSMDDSDQLLDFNLDDVPLLGEEEISPFVCKMGKSSRSKKIIKFRLGGRAHNLTLLEFARRLELYHADEIEEYGFNVYFEGGLRSDEHFNAQEYWLSISREENLGLSMSHTSTIRSPVLRVIHKMITYGLCQKTIGYEKIQKNDLWLLSMFDARHQNGYANFISKIARKSRVLTDDVVRSLSAPIYCRDLDTTPLRDLIDYDGMLIPEDLKLGVHRVGILRPPRASIKDLYDRMGRIEIRQKAIERMEYMQSYNWDSYAQPQYDQYYQQYPPPPPQYPPRYQQQQDDDE
ncbi:hypothetical protein Tco_1254480 [Tanacetum coccineum]